MADRPTVLVVGAATRDLDPFDERGWRLGGSVSYAAIVAAALGARVCALIGVASETASAVELDVIRAAGVDVRPYVLAQGPVFDNRQTAEGRVQYGISASDGLPVDALPNDWHEPDAAILAPVAGELRDDWANAFGDSAFVGLAAQGVLRRLVPGRPVERIPLTRTPLVTRADAILISAEDVAGADVPVDAVLASDQRLLVTHGDRGALAVHVDGSRTRGRYVPALPPRTAVDTTGAGDSFLAAYVVGSLLSRRESAALVLASTVASLSVERATLAQLPTRREICECLVTLRDARRSPA